MIPRGAKTVAAALHGDYQAAQERQAVLATIFTIECAIEV